MKIAFIPIDNRPVCYTLAQQIAKMDNGLELLLPPREMLGDLHKIADVKRIFNWLENLQDVDKVVVSLDTIAYGGLVPSRRSSDSLGKIKKRIEKFKQILSEKNAEIYACSSIMRISNNNINEEEKEYWSEYGKKIFEYSYNYHKNSIAQTDVPQEILEDYIVTRNRNFEVNKIYIQWAQENFFNTLVFSKDDCAKYGFNVIEAKVLATLIASRKCDALIKTGADEIPLSLLARAITKGREVKIAPVYSEPEHVDKISKYEDVSVKESVEGQIELAGGIVCEEKDADIVLLVNNFKEEQGELVMGVDVEGYNKELILHDKPYCIADILNANGADNGFVKQLLKQDLNSDNFFGYAGWNTTGNTLGTVLCCALVKYFASDFNKDAFKEVQLVRFLDDWVYQANVRKKLKADFEVPQLEALQNEMKPYEEKLKEKLGLCCVELKYTYPWNRFFEVEVSF